MTKSGFPHHGGARRLGWVLMILALLPFQSAEAQILGSIRGLVRDDQGIPQMGALVTLVTSLGQEIKRVQTDGNGLFVAGKLPPGSYGVRVALDRFLPITKENIQVAPGASTILDVRLRGLLSSLQLVFPGGGEIRDMSNDWTWVLRTSTSTRPVLRFSPVQERETRSVLRKASGRFHDTHGYAQVSAGAGTRQTALANESDLGTAFAVATSMFGNNNVVLSGNLGYASTSGTPLTAFRTSYRREVAGGTAPEVSVTVRQLHMPVAATQAIFGPSHEESGPKLETFTLGFNDSVKLADVFRLEYGFLYESVQFLNRLNFVSPYGRLIYKVGRNRDIQLRYASGVPNSYETVNQEESGSLRRQVSSLGLFPRVALREGRPTVQRTEHVEVAYREQMGDGLLEVAVYEDSLSDAAVSAHVPAGHFGQGDVLPDLFSDSSTLNAGRFRSQGYRVSYARKIRDRLQAAVGYGSTGVLSPESTELPSADIADLRRSLDMKRQRLCVALGSGPERDDSPAASLLERSSRKTGSDGRV
jgi:hypothetical protein